MTFRQLPVLFVLIAVNVLVFLAQMAGWDWRSVGALFLPMSPFYRHWQWLTHLFLHDNLLHILFNMYALGLFGAPLVRVWGTWRFLVLYLVSGLVAAGLYVIWQMMLLLSLADSVQYSEAAAQAANALLFTPMLGASGAVFGVLAAFAWRLPHVKLGLMFIPIQLPARWFVGLIVGYELFAQLLGVSLFGDNIAHLAHVGGALAGFVLGVGFTWRERKMMEWVWNNRGLE
ncbi:rhomboid family intramembrane serine protease [Neisseriaceae bacterium B1]